MELFDDNNSPANGERTVTAMPSANAAAAVASIVALSACESATSSNENLECRDDAGRRASSQDEGDAQKVARTPMQTPRSVAAPLSSCLPPPPAPPCATPPTAVASDSDRNLSIKADRHSGGTYKNLHVSGLPPTMRDAGLMALFAGLEPLRAKVMIPRSGDPQSHSSSTHFYHEAATADNNGDSSMSASKAFGFVLFASEEAGRRACEHMQRLAAVGATPFPVVVAPARATKLSISTRHRQQLEAKRTQLEAKQQRSFLGRLNPPATSVSERSSHALAHTHHVPALTQNHPHQTQLPPPPPPPPPPLDSILSLTAHRRGEGGRGEGGRRAVPSVEGTATEGGGVVRTGLGNPPLSRPLRVDPYGPAVLFCGHDPCSPAHLRVHDHDRSSHRRHGSRPPEEMAAVASCMMVDSRSNHNHYSNINNRQENNHRLPHDGPGQIWGGGELLYTTPAAVPPHRFHDHDGGGDDDAHRRGGARLAASDADCRNTKDSRSPATSSLLRPHAPRLTASQHPHRLLHSGHRGRDHRDVSAALTPPPLYLAKDTPPRHTYPDDLLVGDEQRRAPPTPPQPLGPSPTSPPTPLSHLSHPCRSPFEGHTTPPPLAAPTTTTTHCPPQQSSRQRQVTGHATAAIDSSNAFLREQHDYHHDDDHHDTGAGAGAGRYRHAPIVIRTHTSTTGQYNGRGRGTYGGSSSGSRGDGSFDYLSQPDQY